MPEGSTITGEQVELEDSGVPNGRVREPRASRPHAVTAIVSFRDGLAARLERWSGRPTFAAVAAMNAITGLAVVVILAGLLLAPYTQLYATSILLLAVKPALAFAPRATRVLALIANLAFALFLALAAWSAAGLAACLPLTHPRRVRVPVERA